MNKDFLRSKVRENLDGIIKNLNKVLSGKGLSELQPTLTRLGRGGKPPHWYEQLLKKHTFPNLDGKSIGSVVEMLLVGILEMKILKDYGEKQLNVNPARGIDIPDLDLGVKSPSENFCTSEPFFSAYERLLGNEHDAVILLTDYQTAKKSPPLRVSIINYSYLQASEIADKNLCDLVRKYRKWLLSENETWAKKLFRFAAYVNQSDWRARQILNFIENLDDESKIPSLIKIAENDYEKQNKKRSLDDRVGISMLDLEKIKAIGKVKPFQLGIITAADDWVAETQKDFGRLPNENEWERLKNSPLNGKIGMSFALQWRYNFGLLFRKR